jgi:hypothetical protein
MKPALAPGAVKFSAPHGRGGAIGHGSQFIAIARDQKDARRDLTGILRTAGQGSQFAIFASSDKIKGWQNF